MARSSDTSAVLVAGGTGALGVAVTRALLAAGRPVVATWMHEEARDRAEAEFAGAASLSLVQADLTRAATAAEAVGAVDRLGAVVNLVGGYAGGARVHETEPDALERMVRLNLLPSFLLARAAMPRLVESGAGTFVAVSARAALRPFAGAAGYIASKAGLLGLVQALDAEYRAEGVRVNAVLPGVIDTPANRAAQPDADRSRWAAPDRIAEVIRFLVSDESSAVSGASITV